MEFAFIPLNIGEEICLALLSENNFQDLELWIRLALISKWWLKIANQESLWKRIFFALGADDSYPLEPLESSKTWKQRTIEITLNRFDPRIVDLFCTMMQPSPVRLSNNRRTLGTKSTIQLVYNIFPLTQSYRSGAHATFFFINHHDAQEAYFLIGAQKSSYTNDILNSAKKVNELKDKYNYSPQEVAINITGNSLGCYVGRPPFSGSIHTPGGFIFGGVPKPYGMSFTTGALIGVWLDMDKGELTFSQDSQLLPRATNFSPKLSGPQSFGVSVPNTAGITIWKTISYNPSNMKQTMANLWDQFKENKTQLSKIKWQLN